MLSETLVVVILAIGICAAVMEARQKRAARTNATKKTSTEQHPFNDEETR